MIFTAGLIIYHVGLVLNNITTKEELKGLFNNPYGNRYTQTWKKNCEKVFCPRLPKKSLLDRMRDKLINVRNQPEKIVSEHEVFKKLDDMWKDIWGETYKDKVKKVQNNNYDHDFTKLQPKYSVEISAGTPRTQISNPSMKRGW